MPLGKKLKIAGIMGFVAISTLLPTKRIAIEPERFEKPPAFYLRAQAGVGPNQLKQFLKAKGMVIKKPVSLTRFEKELLKRKTAQVKRPEPRIQSGVVTKSSSMTQEFGTLLREDPLAFTREMKQTAERIAAGKASLLQKSRAFFEATRIGRENEGVPSGALGIEFNFSGGDETGEQARPPKTATEVFYQTRNGKRFADCDEIVNLNLALLRAVSATYPGGKAVPIVVYLDKDGKPDHHMAYAIVTKEKPPDGEEHFLFRRNEGVRKRVLSQLGLRGSGFHLVVVDPTYREFGSQPKGFFIVHDAFLHSERQRGLGEIFFQKGSNKAEDHLRKAVRLSRGSVDALHDLAYYYMATGQKGKAAYWFDKAVKNKNRAGGYSNARSIYPVHFNYGLTLELMGRYKEALEQFEEASHVLPPDIDGENVARSDAKIKAGEMLLRLGSPREALKRAEDALKLKPGYGDALKLRKEAEKRIREKVLL